MPRTLRLLLLFFFSFWAKSQSYIPYYYHIGKQNGMPTEVVYDLFQDKKGYIWLSTEQGLYRFDGKNYQSYTLEEQTSKSGSCIVEDSLGRIWYSNFDGFIYYVEKGKLNIFKPHIPIGYHKFGIIGKSLFTVEEAGVVVYNVISGRKIKAYHINQKKLNFTHSDGRNFYVFSDKLLIINEKGVKSINLPIELQNFKAGIIQNTKNGLLFTSKHESFGYYFDFKTFKKINFPKAITFVQNTSFDGENNWLCTTDGAYRMGSSEAFLKGYNISNVYRDRQGNSWFSTINNGIFLVPNLDVRFFENKSTITSLASFNNQLLIGTQNEELYADDIFKNEEKLLLKGRNNHEVYMIRAFENIPKIFISSYGFRVLDSGGKLLYEDELAIKDIFPLDDQNFAFASSGSCGFISFGKTNTDWQKIFKTDIIHHHQYTLINKVRGKSVIYDDKKQRLLFATNKGLFSVTKSGVKEILNNGKSLYISRLTKCKDETFALTQNNKILKIDDNKIDEPEFMSILKDIKVLNIKSINDRLYINTDDGIFVFDFLKKEFYKKLSYNQDFEFSQIAEVGDKMYIGVNRGILALPLSYREKKKTYSLVLDELLVNGKIIEDSHHLEFKNNENNLEIKYALLNFTPGENNKVYYKINEGSWQLADKNSRKLSLPSLSAGNYTIRLRTEDESSEPIVIQFFIKQVFWKSWLFILMIGILLISLVIIYYRNQIRRINYRKQLEIDRINLEKESDGSKLKAFKSQMNPHFFYNALNTLQSYIITNDKKPALTYLSQFSNLTRKILEFTEQDNINLEEEIETLKLYLELEKARFNGDLQYEINLKNIDYPHQIFIPVMLLQPYVENALKHGLLHSKKEKKMWIIFEMNNDFLTILIKDNGIGIEKSKIINAQKGNLKPASFATSAQERRIEILNKIYRNNISVSIENNENLNGESGGTLVIIKLKPLNN